MSLRVRMALASGVAVALAVIAVAFSAYAGTSSELKGQKDQSLRSLTAGVLGKSGLGPNGRPARRAGPGGPGQGGRVEPGRGSGARLHQPRAVRAQPTPTITTRASVSTIPTVRRSAAPRGR